MTTTFTLGIVAHPTRRNMAEALAKAAATDLIVYDTNAQGERWCHQETLRRLTATETDWYVWLEDDALPIPDLRANLARALAAAGDAVVSLYLGTGRWAGTIHPPSIADRVARADANHTNWIDADALWHAVGVAIPARHAASLLEHLGNTDAATDAAITKWAKRHQIAIRYTWPSLVDHADTATLAHPGRPSPPRTAWRVGQWTDATRVQ